MSLSKLQPKKKYAGKRNMKEGGGSTTGTETIDVSSHGAGLSRFFSAVVLNLMKDWKV